MKTEMEAQLERLERNLEQYNPYALRHLLPGLTRRQIAQREEAVQATLDPNLRALYSWRNGAYTYSSKQRRYYDDKAEFFHGDIFLGIDEALREGADLATYNIGYYRRPKIVPEEMLDNVLCVFVSIGWGFDPSYSCSFLPFSTSAVLDYDVPIFRTSGLPEDLVVGVHEEFAFDSLIHLFDHINYLYENDCLEIVDPAETAKNFPWHGGNPIRSRKHYENSEERRYQQNAYCATVNQAVFGSPWPSRVLGKGF